MAIYLKIESIPGNITATRHKGAIECFSAQFSANRNVSLKSGITSNRAGGLASFSELKIIKPIDKSSVKLFEHLCNGKVIPSVILEYCQTADEITGYSKYVLSDVIVAKFNEFFDGITEQPLENIALNFTKIEKTFYPRNALNERVAPLITGYDRSTGVLS